MVADLGAVEAGQFDATDRAEAVEFGEEGAQRVAAVDVVGAIGGEDDETAGAQGAQQVGEEVAGGGVGPMQVLQGEDDRAVGGEAFQEAGGEFEEAGRALLVVPYAGSLAQLGEQPGQFLFLSGGRGGQFVGQSAAQGAQRGGEGREGQSVGADLDAAAERDDRARAHGLGGELLDQAGLAHPGLTAEQQRLRAAAPVSPLPAARAAPPPAARANASRNTSSSSARPTNTGLTDLVSTSPSIARPSDTPAPIIRGRPATEPSFTRPPSLHVRLSRQSSGGGCRASAGEWGARAVPGAPRSMGSPPVLN